MPAAEDDVRLGGRTETNEVRHPVPEGLARSPTAGPRKPGQSADTEYRFIERINTA